MKSRSSNQIVEKRLGIPPDYQYKAIRSKNFLQANWHNNKLIVIEKIINITKPKSVLDLGCGSGNFELVFANRIKKITALDYNDQAIGFLRQKLKKNKIKNISLKTASLKNLSNIKNLGKFDLIIMVDVIEHLKFADAEKLISHFNRFLTRNGHVCIITPNYKSPWLLIEKILDKLTIFPHFENEQHLAKFYKGNLKKMFLNEFYIPIYFGTFNLFSYLFPIKHLSSKMTQLELFLSLPFGNLLVYLFKKNKS